MFIHKTRMITIQLLYYNWSNFETWMMNLTWNLLTSNLEVSAPMSRR